MKINGAGIEAEGSEHSRQCGHGHGHITERQHGQEVAHGLMQAGFHSHSLQDHRVAPESHSIYHTEGSRRPELVLQSRDPSQKEKGRVSDIEQPMAGGNQRAFQVQTFWFSDFWELDLLEEEEPGSKRHSRSCLHGLNRCIHGITCFEKIQANFFSSYFVIIKS